jgi:ribosome-associated protein
VTISPPIESDRTEQKRKSLHRACLTAKIAGDYRGKETLVLDMTEVTPIVDFFIITTGSNRRQMHAIAEEVDRVMKEQDSKRIGLEGYEGSEWVLQDYGDTVLHVFSPESRALYDLEHLWADATRIDWQSEVGQSSD